MAANNNVDEISSYIDLAATGAQTEALLAQIKRLEDAYASLSSKSIDLGGLSSTKEITAQIKELQSELLRLQKSKDQVLATDLKAAKVATEKARADALATKSIIDQNKELDRQIALEEKQAAQGVAKRKKEEAAAAKELALAAKLEPDAKATINKQSSDAAARKVAQDKQSEAIARKYNADQAKAEAKASSDLAKQQAAEKKTADDLANKYKQLTLAYNEAALKAKNLRLELVNVQTTASKGLTTGTFNTNFAQVAKIREAEAAASALKDKIRELDLATGNTTSSIGRYNEGIKQVEVTSKGAFAAVGKFYGFLRVAANIIPGLGISGIFLLGFEAIKFAAQGLGFFNETVDKSAEKIAKQKKELEELIDSFRDIGEINDAATGSTQGGIVRVQALAAAVTDQTKSYKERNAALTELKEINKAYFGDLTLETATVTALTKVINEYTDAIVNQAVLKELEGDIGKVSVAYSRQIRVVEDLSNKVKQVQGVFDNLDPNKLPSQQGITNQTLNNFIELKRNLAEQAKALKPLREQYDKLRQEIFDATAAGLKFKDLNPGKDTQNSGTRLRTFDSKDNEDQLKRFIQLEKDVSAVIDNELGVRLSLRQDAFKKEYDLLLASVAQEKKVAQDAANDVLNDPKADKNTRINAERKLRAELETIDNNFNAKDLQLQQQFEADYDKILLSARLKRLADEKRDNDLFFKTQQDAQEKRLKIADNRNQTDQSVLAQIRDAALAKLEAARVVDAGSKEKQLRADQEYEHNRLKIESDFLISSTILNLQYFENLLAIKKVSRTGLSDVEKSERDKEIEALKAQIEALKKQLAAARTAQKKDTKKSADEELEALVKTFAKIQEYSQKITDLIGNALNISIVAQKNALQEQADLIDANSKKEIDAINASADAASVKADKIAVIEARAQTQREEVQRRQRQLDQQKAAFDKAANIAGIITATALAVVKALPSIPLAIAVGALGAAELAVAIATPIPKYKHGTKNHPGGPAEVGHGQPEYVLLPSGKGFITGSTPVQMDLPKGTKVYPDLNRLPEDIMRMAMKPVRPMPTAGRDNTAEVLSKKMDTLTNVIRNKPVLNQKATRNGLFAMWQHGESWSKYVNEQTRF